MKSSEIKTIERTRKYSLKHLKRFKKEGIKAILLLSTGTDHFPVKEAEEMGFIVKNVYYRSELAVASFGFKLLDDLNRKIFTRYPFEYEGKTAIIIGSAGRIGKKLNKICRGYGMKVYAHDIKNKFSTAKKLQKNLLIAKAIFLCCDLNNSTKNYFNSNDYLLMNNSPLIINVVGRLELISLHELQKYLYTDTVGGYACDEIPRHPLINHKNCLFTKHIAWKSSECVIRRLKAESKAYNELLNLKV